MDVPLAQGLLGRGIRWWMSTMPGLAIVVAVMFNLLGDALSDALDVRDR
jgi:ABC-type dipeptide/oligopeptide/nickel transport system permease subunit